MQCDLEYIEHSLTQQLIKKNGIFDVYSFQFSFTGNIPEKIATGLLVICETKNKKK